jgi:hypothetical protein
MFRGEIPEAAGLELQPAGSNPTISQTKDATRCLNRDISVPIYYWKRTKDVAAIR